MFFVKVRLGSEIQDFIENALLTKQICYMHKYKNLYGIYGKQSPMSKDPPAKKMYRFFFQSPC